MWNRTPVILRAIVVGIVVGLAAANIWVPLLLTLGMPLAAGAEVAFLALYVWWARGGGPPRSWKAFRAESFRSRKLTGRDWAWGLVAALAIPASVHAAIVVLFRFVPFPAEAFHQGYDLSKFHYDLSIFSAREMQLAVCVVSAMSAGICEETGFRGYMQQPIEKRHGAFAAILISAFFFMLLHLNKSWSVPGMVPIVFGAGVLYGLLAWASRSLVFAMIGHTLMDIGLFVFWWGQIFGTFTQRPIAETGMDGMFYAECGALAAAVVIALIAIARLRRIST